MCPFSVPRFRHFAAELEIVLVYTLHNKVFGLAFLEALSVGITFGVAFGVGVSVACCSWDVRRLASGCEDEGMVFSSVELAGMLVSASDRESPRFC